MDPARRLAFCLSSRARSLCRRTSLVDVVLGIDSLNALAGAGGPAFMPAALTGRAVASVAARELRGGARGRLDGHPQPRRARRQARPPHAPPSFSPRARSGLRAPSATFSYVCESGPTATGFTVVVGTQAPTPSLTRSSSELVPPGLLEGATASQLSKSPGKEQTRLRRPACCVQPQVLQRSTAPARFASCSTFSPLFWLLIVASLSKRRFSAAVIESKHVCMNLPGGCRGANCSPAACPLAALPTAGCIYTHACTYA